MLPDSLKFSTDIVKADPNWLGMIGAGAWLPWVFKWLYSLFIKPAIQVKAVQRAVHITNSTSGPYLSIPLSIASYRKNASVKELTITLTNEVLKTEKTYSCYSSSDISIRKIIAKDGMIDQWETTPLGIIILEPEKAIIRGFNFNEPKDEEEYIKTHSGILRRIGIEKSKNPDFVLDTNFLRDLSETIQMKENFEEATNWTPGNYIFTLKISIFERKRPYIFYTKGNFERVKADQLSADREKFNKWLISMNLLEQKDYPYFNTVSIIIEPFKSA